MQVAPATNNPQYLIRPNSGISNAYRIEGFQALQNDADFFTPNLPDMIRQGTR
jgi:hypothetical protein